MTSSAMFVDVRRNGLSECVHRIHGALVDREGKVMQSWGDIATPVFPRSTLKAFQALPLLETGAADAFSLSDQEIALAGASHNGEKEHVDLVRAWLDRVKLDEADLECGAHWPYFKESEVAMIRAGEKPCNLHNNCSGKHLGMMTACLHNNWSVKGYTDASHPLQKMILPAIADLAEYPLDKMVVGIDGCSAPNPAMPLENLAGAFARLAGTDSGKRMIAAMTAHPFCVAGTGRFDTLLMKAAQGTLASKIGAEGNLVVTHVPSGAVLYLKSEDGNHRGTYAVVGKIMAEAGWMTDPIDTAIADHIRPVIKNWRGTVTGDIVVRC